MGLTWRDLVTTVLAGMVALVGLAVSGEWGWPMLGSFRMGSLVVGLLGIGMCIASGSGSSMESGLKEQDGAVKVLAVLGVVSFALLITGVIVGSEVLFMGLTIVTIGMWLMATIRHAAAGSMRHAPHASGA
jgi:hypothetical protein